MLEFTRVLISLTHVSTEYAVAAFHTLTDEDKEDPVEAAKKYAKRHSLLLKK